MAVYENLPGVPHEIQDGGLQVLTTSNAPRVLVLGTAGKGTSDPYVVGRSQEAAVEFGTSGTLTRGMYETKTGGAENVILMRVGATAAVLEGIGVDAVTGGITITTVLKDDSASSDYSLYWNNTSHRLQVKKVATDVVVFDRDFDNPSATIDLGEVVVTGTFTAVQGKTIGDASGTWPTLTEAPYTYDVTLTDGTDGTSPSRMKLYEYLFDAYKLLENEDFDEVVPMDVYLDDANVADSDTATISDNTYPVAGSSDDILCYFYAEEYEGQWYFWWRYDSKTTGSPDLYPVGYQDTSQNGTDLTDTVFSEVNFAYQLSNFCYDISRATNQCFGFIGVRPPASIGLRDVSNWIGKLPVYTTDATPTVSTNGTGLLGNKFMSGKIGFRAAAAYGGFVATDTGFVDGTEEEDRGGHVIDLGAYLNMAGAWTSVYNAFDTSGLGYITTFAPTYAGFVSALDTKQAPTNKVCPVVTLPFRINNTKLDQLAGAGYVFCKQAPKGTVVADAPTAARPDSDFTRLTTVRIIKEVVDAIRMAADPFIGNVMGGIERAALQTACDGAMAKLQKAGYVQRFDLNLTATPAERAQGKATVELTIVPAFELREVTLIISLSVI